MEAQGQMATLSSVSPGPVDRVHSAIVNQWHIQPRQAKHHFWKRDV